MAERGPPGGEEARATEEDAPLPDLAFVPGGESGPESGPEVRGEEGRATEAWSREVSCFLFWDLERLWWVASVVAIWC